MTTIVTRCCLLCLLQPAAWLGVVLCIAMSVCGTAVISISHRNFRNSHNSPLAASSCMLCHWDLVTSNICLQDVLCHYSSLRVCRMLLDRPMVLSHLLCRYRTCDWLSAQLRLETSTTLRPVLIYCQGPTLPGMDHNVSPLFASITSHSFPTACQNTLRSTS